MSKRGDRQNTIRYHSTFKEFFQKFIESKHYDKLENLKMFMCDELDIEDVYEDRKEREGNDWKVG